MRASTVVTVLGLGLFVAAGARPARALTEEIVKAHVPFAFHVYDTTLPPGNYVIKQVDMVSPGLLEIRKDDDRARAFFLTEQTGPQRSLRNAELVFDRYGQTRFLHAIRVPDDTGAQLVVSRPEVRAARAMAAASSKKAPGATAHPGALR